MDSHLKSVILFCWIIKIDLKKRSGENAHREIGKSKGRDDLGMAVLHIPSDLNATSSKEHEVEEENTDK